MPSGRRPASIWKERRRCSRRPSKTPSPSARPPPSKARRSQPRRWWRRYRLAGRAPVLRRHLPEHRGTTSPRALRLGRTDHRLAPVQGHGGTVACKGQRGDVARLVPSGYPELKHGRTVEFEQGVPGSLRPVALQSRSAHLIAHGQLRSERNRREPGLEKGREGGALRFTLGACPEIRERRRRGCSVRARLIRCRRPSVVPGGGAASTGASAGGRALSPVPSPVPGLGPVPGLWSGPGPGPRPADCAPSKSRSGKACSAAVLDAGCAGPPMLSQVPRPSAARSAMSAAPCRRNRRSMRRAMGCAPSTLLLPVQHRGGDLRGIPRIGAQ